MLYAVEIQRNVDLNHCATPVLEGSLVQGFDGVMAVSARAKTIRGV